MPRVLRTSCALGAISLSLLSGSAEAGYLFSFNDPSGLSAEAEFTLVNPTTLQIRLKNTSTGVPVGFQSADQLLTGVSWDFGHPGWNGDVMITGGQVYTGLTSASVNFSVQNVGANQDVSGEYGYGNMDGTGALTNFVSANAAQGTPFGGPNLDGPASVDGPQGGLLSSAFSIPLGGIGAIQDEIIATLTLSGPYTNAELLTDLLNNGTRVEFGSDAAFIPGVFVPGPSALALLALGMVGGRSRRRAKA